MSTLDFALAYAARGWPVFVLSTTKKPTRNCEPCRRRHCTPAEKEACECVTCHGFYAATTDVARIREMLRRNPRGLLAVRTGSPSGIAVVDVDFRTFDGDMPAHHDRAWQTMEHLDAQGLLPATLTQSTGSGGLHFLYGHPGGYVMSGGGKYGPRVDSKADGAYIVVAPSVSPDGPYAWARGHNFDLPLTPLPEELAARVRPPEPKVILKRSVSSPWTRPGVVQGRLLGLVQTVLDTPPGGRNDRLYWAAKKAGAMIQSGEIDEDVVVGILSDVGHAVGLTTSEIGDATGGTIGSGLRNGRLVGS